MFGESLRLDSIDTLEIVAMLEKYHGIQVDDIEQSRKAFTSVNSPAELIREHADAW